MSSKTDSRNSSPQASVTIREVKEEQNGQRLDNYLLARLKGVPKSRIYRIIRKGEVRVNKKREKPEYKLKTGDLVRIPPVRTAGPREIVPPSDTLQVLLEKAVLYDDECLMILNKPAGLPVHGGTGVKTGLIEAMRFMHPGVEGLELAHRLDKGTSGCLILAKTAKVLKILAGQFKSGAVSKTYHAIVQGQWPEDSLEVRAALKRQPPRGGERRVSVSDAGKSAITRFSVIERFAEATYLQANPLTGRTHQIRVHAQLAGHPIIGDEKYASAGDRRRFAEMGIKRLCLHASELSLPHPQSGKTLTVEAPHDEQFTLALRILERAGD